MEPTKTLAQTLRASRQGFGRLYEPVTRGWQLTPLVMLRVLNFKKERKTSFTDGGCVDSSDE